MSRRVVLPFDSPYGKTDLYQVADISTGAPTNTFVWGIWNPIDFPPSDIDATYRVRITDLGRLDLLAYQYYENVNLWWVIAYVNDIVDPLTDMSIGQLLRIPSREVVFSTLLNQGLRKGAVVDDD